jgi:hypothetical protein
LAPPSEVRILSPPLERTLCHAAAPTGLHWSADGDGAPVDPATPPPPPCAYFLNWKIAVWTVLSTSFTESWRHVPDQDFSVFQT